MEYFCGGMEIMSWKLGYTAKMNSVGFPSKLMHMWLPVTSDEICGRSEQFHDCFIPIAAKNWCPTRRVLSHEKGPLKEAHWVLILRKAFLSVGSCQKLYILWLLIHPLFVKRTEDLWEVPGGSSKSLCLYADSWPMSISDNVAEIIMVGEC
jgi:hypothetical protein